jgi:hypothetical protein
MTFVTKGDVTYLMSEPEMVPPTLPDDAMGTDRGAD